MTKYSATPRGNRCARLWVHTTAAEWSSTWEEKLSSKPFTKGRKGLDMCWELNLGPQRWTPFINHFFTRPFDHASASRCLMDFCRVLKRCIVLTSRNFKRSDCFISLDLDWIYSIRRLWTFKKLCWKIKSCGLTSSSATVRRLVRSPEWLTKYKLEMRFQL